MSVCALPTHTQKIKQECLFYSVLGGKTPFQATNRQKLDIPSFNLVEETFVKFFVCILYQDVPLAEFMNIVFTRMPGGSYRR